MPLSHLLGTIASSVVTGFVFTGTVLLASAPQPVYREDALTTRWFGVNGDVRKDATGGPFGGPCAVFGANSADLSGLVYGGDPDEIYLADEDFTIECWIAGSGSEPSAEATFMSHWSTNATYRTWDLDYNPSTDVVRFRLRTQGSSTTRTASFTVSNPSTFFDGTWHHIAAERVGTVITVYVDGVAGGTTYTIGTDLLRDPNTFYRPAIGCFSTELPDFTFLGGKITETRITRGSYRYGTGFTPPTAEFPRGAIDDADWANVIWLVGMNGDWGYNLVGSLAVEPDDLNFPTTGQGQTSDTTGVIENNGYTMQEFDSGVQLTYTAPSGMNPGSADFTVEMIFTYTAALSNNAFFGFCTATDLCYFFRRDGGGPVLIQAIVSTDGSSNSVTLQATDPGAGTHHIALVREGTALRFYLNGTLVDSDTVSGALFDPTGALFSINRQNINFQNAGFRIIAGQAIYTGSTFTPPTAAQLLLDPS